ncbi:hypothetical protein [Prosthecomicrobium sp. N25]
MVLATQSKMRRPVLAVRMRLHSLDLVALAGSFAVVLFFVLF